MIYIITFFLSVLILNFSVFFYKLEKNRVGHIFLVIGLILPATLAGLRDISIGTDTSFYVLEAYRAAYRADDYNYYLMKSYLEPGYSFFNYNITKFFENIHWVLFFIQWFILSFIAWSILNIRQYKLFPWVFLTYFMLYFNNSLNMTRQSMAIVICIFSFSYLLKKQYIISFFVALIALFFHFTSFIFLSVFILYFFSIKVKKHFWFIQVAMVIIAATVVIALDNLITLFIGSGVLTDKYDAYTSKGSFGSNIPLSDLFLSIAVFTLFFVFQRFSNLEKNLKRFFSTIFLISIVLCFAAVKSTFAVRGMYYFSYLSIIILPMLVNSVDNKYQKLLKVLLLFLYIMFWLLTVVVANLGETYPYTSKIMNL